jgi:hypothetical protein
MISDNGWSCSFCDWARGYKLLTKKNRLLAKCYRGRRRRKETKLISKLYIGKVTDFLNTL